MTALHAKVPLTLHDPSQSVLSSALTKLDSLLSRDVSKNRISQADADSARERVRGCTGDGTEGEVIEGADLVIEVGRAAQRMFGSRTDEGMIRLFRKYRTSSLGCFSVWETCCPLRRYWAATPAPSLSRGWRRQLRTRAKIRNRQHVWSGESRLLRGRGRSRVCRIHFFNPVPQM